MDKSIYKNILNKIGAKLSEYNNEEKIIMEKLEIISVRDKVLTLNKDSEQDALYKQVCNEIFSENSVETLEGELKEIRTKIVYCKDIAKTIKEEYGISFGENDVLFDFLKPKKS